MSKKKERIIFAEHTPTGKLYVLLAEIMHPFVAMCDGLPVTFFQDDRKAWLDVDDALAWCRRELADAFSERAKITLQIKIAVMERLKAQHPKAGD